MKQTHFVPPGHFLNVSWYSPFCLQLCQAPKYQCSNSVKLALLEKKKEMFFALIPVLIFSCIFFFLCQLFSQEAQNWTNLARLWPNRWEKVARW